MEDEPILGYDHYRVSFLHTTLRTRHHVDVAIPIYTLQPAMSGGEGQAKKAALRIVEAWGKVGIAPHKLIVSGVTFQGRSSGRDKMSLDGIGEVGP